MNTEPQTPSTPRRVAIQGVRGCFHEAAARACFPGGHAVDVVECDTFPDLFDALDDEPDLYGIVAFENTIAGSILSNYELLRKSRLRVVTEHKMRISHVLCALPGQSIADIRSVHSHPMALMQCEQYLRRHPGMHMVEAFDTAGAAAEIAANGTMGAAAVCGEYAAGLYGLDILARGIETNKHNFTRFLLLTHPEALAPQPADDGAVDKASVMFTLPHTKGALSKVLTILSFYDMNLSKIQSTPMIGREWEYRFYVDLTFESALRYRQAVEAVRPLTSDFRVLGEYKSCD